MTYEIWLPSDREILYFPMGFSELNNDYAQKKYQYVLDLGIISIRKWKREME